jgi:DNA primase
MKGRIVFPIHSVDGVLVGYAGRSLGPEEPRYKFPPGLRKSLLLFNLHRAIRCQPSRAVAVVEGFFDCMKVHQAGRPCVVALMGSTLSPCQADLLRQHFVEVILMLDGDAAGRTATAAITARLRPSLAVRIARVPHGQQPDQLSSSEIRQFMDEAR